MGFCDAKKIAGASGAKYVEPYGQGGGSIPPPPSDPPPPARVQTPHTHPSSVPMPVWLSLPRACPHCPGPHDASNLAAHC